ncbi:MAG: nucleoside phosphorylase [Erysipelotrichaceae bacterium]|nr:nucleoside phosphorylase [Erysipelotrichaceae bacterium]
MKFKSQKMLLADGGLHHLGAKEEDVCETMILTCASEDVPRIAAYLEDAKESASHREYLTYQGTIQGRKLAVMSIGHGCMPMAIAVEELNQLNVKTIVKVGYGQALIPGIRPGTIIIPSAAVRSEGATKEYLPESYPACAHLPLIHALVKAFQENGIEPEVGIVRSHDAFYTEQLSDPHGKEKINYWANLGILLNEHECSAMFVLSEIFRMKAAAVLIVKENLADGTALDEETFRDAEETVYRIVTKEIGENW